MFEKNKQSRVISFARLPQKAQFYGPGFEARRTEKERPKAAPNIFILPHMKIDVNIYLPENVVFGVLHQINRTFLDSIPSCENAGGMLLYKYKKDSSNKRIPKDEGFPIIFRLYKFVT